MSEKRKNVDDGCGEKRMCIVNDKLLQSDCCEVSPVSRADSTPTIHSCSAKDVEAENGIIEKITIQNFMCHTYLSLDVGPNVNIVHGRNGSGKSAILKAVVFCFNGKCLRSKRRSKNFDFLKETSSPAVISVQLKNHGSEPFKPDVYDTSIMIERTIFPNETSSLNIQTKKGTVISTKQQDLDDILYHFNIEIDKSVSFLSQDSIHNVMNIFDQERELYKIFLKALRLENLSDDYPKEDEQCDLLDFRKVVEQLLRMEDNLDELTDEAEKAEKMSLLNSENIQLKKSVFTKPREIAAEKQVRIDQQRHIGGILKRLVEVKEKLITVLTNMGTLREHNRKLEELLKDQDEKNQRGLCLMGVRIRNTFRSVLSECGYSGNMKMNHETQRLSLLVDCNRGNRNAHLSVGEESFSIIAFYLALWHSMETPFRCLDEFSGFLDAQNERTVLQVIMKLTKPETHRQFILLTTQDMSNVEEDSYVKIFRLRDPERYGSTDTNTVQDSTCSNDVLYSS